MKAVILAAGVASRLRPLTDDTPKCLLKVGKKTILGQTVDNLLINSINDIVIVTGYLQERIISFMENNYPGLNVTYIYNDVYSSTNNIYSLWLAMDQVKNNSMLLLDSDILFDKKIIGLLLKSEQENCLALNSQKSLSDEEIKVKVNGAGFISEISKEVAVDCAIGESIGIEKFSGEVLHKLNTELQRMISVEKKVDVWYEEAFQNIINDGASIAPIDVGELVCMELDTFEDLKQAAEEVAPYLT